MTPGLIEAGCLAIVSLVLAYFLAKNPPPPGSGSDPWGYQ